MGGNEESFLSAAENAARRAAGALRLALASLVINVSLAIVKITAGIAGHSYALVADGIESLTDGLVSVIVVLGIRVAAKPPDAEHPFGHGRAENIAGLVVSFSLYIAAVLIALQAIAEIRHPHRGPEWWTLAVLLGVVLIKSAYSRHQLAEAERLGSTSLRADAFHHWSDAVTSFAAMIGIAVALAGGEGWESADDWAALLGCLLIAYNATGILRRTLDEAMDRTVEEDLEGKLRTAAGSVPGVRRIEKCRVRRSGFGLMMDIHVQVDGNLSVAEGHRIAGAVKHTLLRSDLGVADVVTHLEPFEPEETPRRNPS